MNANRYVKAIEKKKDKPVSLLAMKVQDKQPSSIGDSYIFRNIQYSKNDNQNYIGVSCDEGTMRWDRE